jgi:hypothetical protein
VCLPRKFPLKFTGTHEVGVNSVPRIRDPLAGVNSVLRIRGPLGGVINLANSKLICFSETR